MKRRMRRSISAKTGLNVDEVLGADRDKDSGTAGRSEGTASGADL